MPTSITSTPFSNLPFPYVYGMQLAWASNTTLTVTPGVCKDSTNLLDMNVGNYGASNAANITINGAVNGLNGLDTGSLANNTWYYVYAVSDQTGFNPSGYMVSTSATGPIMPKGAVNLANYSSYRRIGWAFTNGSAQFINFTQSGTSNQRYYQWVPQMYLVNYPGGSTPTTQTNVNASLVMPPSLIPGYFGIAYKHPSGSSPLGGGAFFATNSTYFNVSFDQAVNVQGNFYTKLMPGLNAGNYQFSLFANLAVDVFSIYCIGYDDFI